MFLDPAHQLAVIMHIIYKFTDVCGESTEVRNLSACGGFSTVRVRGGGVLMVLQHPFAAQDFTRRVPGDPAEHPSFAFTS